MALKVTKTSVWSAEIADRPGGLATSLEALAGGGASLKVVIARRMPDKKGRGIVFLGPIAGKRARKAAGKAGFKPGRPIPALKIEGNDRSGLGARIARAIGSSGVNLRGISAIAYGKKFIAYAAFDTGAAAGKAAKALKKVK